MVDLMNDTYSYAELKKKYDQFTVPAMKVLVAGTDIMKQKDFHLEQIQVKLSLESANSASFRLTHCYDYESSSLNAQVKNKMVLGNKLEVELGYGSSTVKVFSGFIASIGISFSETEGAGFDIVALDARRLMMNDNHVNLVYKVKNYSDAVKQILSKYSELCKPEVEATNDKLEEDLTQNSSDYSFIQDTIIKSGKADREFFILADKAYFRTPQKNKSAIMTLGFGNGLISFSRSATYLNMEIEVVGYDDKQKKTVRTTKKVKSGEKTVNAISAVTKLTINDQNSTTQEATKKQAENLSNELKKEKKKGSGRCVGLPQLVPGRYLKLDKLDATMNKNYYLSEVTHSCGSHGFTTDFEIGGWE